MDRGDHPGPRAAGDIVRRFSGVSDNFDDATPATGPAPAAAAGGETHTKWLLMAMLAPWFTASRLVTREADDSQRMMGGGRDEASFLAGSG